MKIRKRWLGIGSVVAVGWALLGGGTAMADGWPQRRGPGNNGISAERAWIHEWPAEGPTVLWKAEVGTGFSSFAAGDGKVFTLGNASDRDTLVALDAVTGRVLWQESHREPLNPKMYEGGPNTTPTLEGGRVLTMSRSGLVLCREAASGALVWSNQLSRVVKEKNGTWGAGASPLVVGDRVLLNYGPALVALHRADGRVLWTSGQEKKGEYSFATPVVPAGDAAGKAWVLMNLALLEVNLEDGRVNWRSEFGSGYRTHCADPLVVPGGVFVSSGDDGGEFLSLENGKPARRWKNKNLSSHMASPVFLEGHLYGIDSGGYKQGQQRLRCVDLATGEIRWEQDGVGQGSLVLAGDRLIVLSEQGELLVVKARPDRAEVLARSQVLGGKCWTQPVLSAGLLYCRNAKGNVVCLDLRPKAG